MRVTEEYELMSKLGEFASREEPKLDDGDRALLLHAADCLSARTEAMQAESQRINRLEDQISEMRVAMASMEGRISAIKTGIDGEHRLVQQMLGRLDEKIDSIELNTSRQQNNRRTWQIALIAALPGIASVIIMVIELLTA